MRKSRCAVRTGWLVLGVLAGLVIAGLWPRSPLHAVATDRVDTFAVATGQVGNEVEAIYFLDLLSGDLRAAVINRHSGKFSAFFQANVLQALGADPAKKPRFMMVTGMADLRRGGPRMQTGLSLVYVAEVTSGKVAAYGVPWGPTTTTPGQVIQKPLLLMDVTTFRAVPPTSGAAMHTGPSGAIR